MTAVFYSNAWEGSIKADGEEVSKAQFFPLDNLPDLPENEAQSLPNLFNFKKTGQVELY
jgi:NADH pyrophosphatase NudC (nudix superfamily)